MSVKSDFTVFFCNICCSCCTDIHIIMICTLVLYNNRCIFRLCKFLCQRDCLLQFLITEFTYQSLTFFCQRIVRYEHVLKFCYITGSLYIKFINFINLSIQFFCRCFNDIILRNRCYGAVCTCYVHRIVIFCGIWYHGVLISISFVVRKQVCGKCILTAALVSGSL